MLGLSSYRFTGLLVATFLFGAASLLTGCAGGAAGADSTSGQFTESRSSIATAIAAKAAATPAGTPTATPEPRTVAQVSASAPASGLLDSKHIAAGIGCTACHESLPPEGKPAMPTTAKCLSCHGGSYDAIAAKTAKAGPINPHKAHTGRQDCDRCHHVHRPFEYSCNACHSFPVPQKFISSVPRSEG